jgi:hypothetical protein
MIVLDSDPLTSPPEKLLSTKVELTILGGKLVYSRSQSQALTSLFHHRNTRFR